MRDYSAHLPVAGQAVPRRGRESLPVAATEGQCVDTVIAYITRGDRVVGFDEPELRSAARKVGGLLAAAVAADRAPPPTRGRRAGKALAENPR